MLLLLISCQEKHSAYPPIWVEDLQEADSIALKDELLQLMEQETYTWMDAQGIDVYLNLACPPSLTPCLLIVEKKNGVHKEALTPPWEGDWEGGT